MTQKELLYLEDAVEHEKSIIKLCSEFIKELKNSELSDYMKEQINKHQEMKDKIMSFIKEKANG